MFESVSSIDKYVIGATLGRGSYGKVKEVFDSETLCRRAMKILKSSSMLKVSQGKFNAENEMKILSKCDHKNVIAIFDAMCDTESNDIYYVFEFGVCDIMTLMKTSNSQGFHADQSHFYFRQILNGVEYLHSNRIVHKDLKPSNILLNQAEIIKIIDFGVSEKLDIFAEDGMCTTSNGSPAFQSPEVLKGVTPFNGYKLDSWGCGLILYFLSTGQVPFYANNLYAMMRKIEEGDYVVPTVNAKVSEKLVHLIKNILTMDPKARPDVAKIRSHEWVENKPPPSKEKVSLECVAKRDNLSFGMTTIAEIQRLASGVPPREIIRSRSDLVVSGKASGILRK